MVNGGGGETGMHRGGDGSRGNKEMEGLMEVIDEVMEEEVIKEVGGDYIGGGVGCRGGDGGG